MSDRRKKPVWKNRHFSSSLRFATTGLVTAFIQERNLRFHTCMTALMVGVGVWFKLVPWEWCALFSAVFAVVFAEITNTVVENVVDLTTHYARHPLAKAAKDMAAGAVLLSALYAVVIGLLVFGPHVLDLIHRF